MDFFESEVSSEMTFPVTLNFAGSSLCSEEGSEEGKAGSSEVFSEEGIVSSSLCSEGKASSSEIGSEDRRDSWEGLESSFGISSCEVSSDSYSYVFSLFWEIYFNTSWNI